MAAGFHLLARMFGDVTYVTRAEYSDRAAMFDTHVARITALSAAARQGGLERLSGPRRVRPLDLTIWGLLPGRPEVQLGRTALHQTVSNPPAQCQMMSALQGCSMLCMLS